MTKPRKTVEGGINEPIREYGNNLLNLQYQEKSQRWHIALIHFLRNSCHIAEREINGVSNVWIGAVAEPTKQMS